MANFRRMVNLFRRSRVNREIEAEIRVHIEMRTEEIRLLVVGSCAGMLLGLAAARVLAAIVYQASPHDPVVLAGTVLAMLAVGLVATWAPAQRALRVNPSMLMREE